MLNRAVLNHHPSSRNLLTRVLAVPDLPAQIRALPSQALGKLLDHVGLEDSAELVALARPEQLVELLDVDVWRSPRAGEDERFDSERFLLWIHVLLETGERFAAERLAELSPDLLTLAVHRHVLVLEQQTLEWALAESDDADTTEKVLDGCLSEELDAFLLVWRGGDGWDDVLSALLALDRDHHGLVVDLLERCAQLSREHIDDQGGLYEVLSSEEMLEGDLGAERESRRGERGYVAPSAAAAFLRLALREPAPASGERDPLTRAYFRDLSRAPQAPATAATKTPPQRDLTLLLESADLSPLPKAKRLAGARSNTPEAPLLSAAFALLGRDSPAALAARHDELAYLANVLTAGCTVAGKRLTPVEAIEHAITCVSLGLWLAVQGTPASEVVAVAAVALETETCDGLLRSAFAAALEPGRRLKPKSAAAALAAVKALLKSMKV